MQKHETMTLEHFAKKYAPDKARIEIQGNTLIVEKWHWEYSECLFFQKLSQKYVQVNRKDKIYIFTNHPHVFTLGRGNERGLEGLEDLTAQQEESLLFPLHKIHRGGGLTFHYPGQWIFYPIVSINQNYTLEKHTHWLLSSVKDVLGKDFQIPNVITANRLMGVWKDRCKLASIGVGLSRFVTQHGLALNVNYDEKMFSEVNKVHPCGISPTTYTTVDSFIARETDLVELFHQAYLSRIISV